MASYYEYKSPDYGYDPAGSGNVPPKKPETYEDWAKRHPYIKGPSPSRIARIEALRREAWANSQPKVTKAQYEWDLYHANQKYQSELEQFKTNWATEFSSAKEEWAQTSSKQQQDLKNQLLGEFKIQADTYSKRVNELKSMYSQREAGYKDQINQTHQRYADRDAERSRIADMYGQSDRRQIKGVKTQDELSGSTSRLPSNFFRRSGNRMKTSSLNIS